MTETEPSLTGLRVLLAEDEYLLMDALNGALRDAGATVLGPVATVTAMQRLIAGEPAIDAAILDINLRGQQVFAGAEVLAGRDVPFVFTTGYDADAIPPRFAAVPRCQKPVRAQAVLRALGRLVGKVPS